MIYLNIGEPDFTAPTLVQEAAAKAIRDGSTQYTAATGLPALRKRISAWYQQRFGLGVGAERIVVTAGASAALQLACLALIERGDELLMPDPSYRATGVSWVQQMAPRCWCPQPPPNAFNSVPTRWRKPGNGTARAVYCSPRHPIRPARRFILTSCGVSTPWWPRKAASPWSTRFILRWVMTRNTGRPHWRWTATSSASTVSANISV